MKREKNIAVVLPTYKTRDHILDVIARIGAEVSTIYVVDDACPERTGEYVKSRCQDDRVMLIKHSENLGVGGAVMTGYTAAILNGCDIIVKIDSDGQMDPALLPQFVAPILDGEADYTKGNRFFDIESVKTMPKIRLFGNTVLSFMCKLSSGYWSTFDPTNGYTAIHSNVASRLPFDKISKRYFFESDILFRLNTIRAVVVDIPMEAKYGDEVSNLKISKIVGEFFVKHITNFSKRLFYNYYLRDMSLASIELPIGLSLMVFGVLKGLFSWAWYSDLGQVTPAGTVMLSALPVLVGLQLVLAFFAFDISSAPTRPVHKNTNKPNI